MNRFEVFSGAVCVGSSGLERGDPPMGVAVGRFLPTAAYRAIQSSVIATREKSQDQLTLTIRVVDGREIATAGGVHISDFSVELGEEEIEVEVMGIVSPPYEEIFPDHIAAYRARFES